MFDTAVDDFNFGQLFSVNRYLGNDRIGDANQLTLALTSRLLDPEHRRRAAARRRRPALLFPESAGRAERIAALGVARPTCSSAPRAGSPTPGRSPRCGSTTRMRSRPSACTRASGTRRRRAGSSTRATRYSRQFVDPIGRQSRLNQFDLSWQLPGQPELDAARPVELLAPRQQDAGGRGRRRVQCRLLGLAARRPATGDDHADDVEFGLPADRIERIGAVRD